MCSSILHKYGKGVHGHRVQRTIEQSDSSVKTSCPTTTSPLQPFANSEKRLSLNVQRCMSLEALERKRLLTYFFLFPQGKEKGSLIFLFQALELYFRAPGKTD